MRALVNVESTAQAGGEATGRSEEPDPEVEHFGECEEAERHGSPRSDANGRGNRPSQEVAAQEAR